MAFGSGRPPYANAQGGILVEGIARHTRLIWYDGKSSGGRLPPNSNARRFMATFDGGRKFRPPNSRRAMAARQQDASSASVVHEGELTGGRRQSISTTRWQVCFVVPVPVLRSGRGHVQS